MQPRQNDDWEFQAFRCVDSHNVDSLAAKLNRCLPFARFLVNQNPQELNETRQRWRVGIPLEVACQVQQFLVIRPSLSSLPPGCQRANHPSIVNDSEKKLVYRDALCEFPLSFQTVHRYLKSWMLCRRAL